MRKQSSEKLRGQHKVTCWWWCRNSHPSTSGSGFTASPTEQRSSLSHASISSCLYPTIQEEGGSSEAEAHRAPPRPQGRPALLCIFLAAGWRGSSGACGPGHLPLSPCSQAPTSFFRATENKEEGTNHSSNGAEEMEQGNELGSSSTNWMQMILLFSGLTEKGDSSRLHPKASAGNLQFHTEARMNNGQLTTHSNQHGESQGYC